MFMFDHAVSRGMVALQAAILLSRIRPFPQLTPAELVKIKQDPIFIIEPTFFVFVLIHALAGQRLIEVMYE